MTSPLEIGSLLVASRVAQGIAQRELARRVGVKQPQIARWEASEYRSASLAHVDKVARALGIDIGLPLPPLAAESPAPYDIVAPISEVAALALARLGVRPNAIAAFCRLHGVREMALFGSSLRDDLGPRSDVDVLVKWADEREPHGLQALLDTEDELAAIFRRTVDLVDRASVETSANYIRREHILAEAEVIYAAR